MTTPNVVTTSVPEAAPVVEQQSTAAPVAEAPKAELPEKFGIESIINKLAHKPVPSEEATPVAEAPVEGAPAETPVVEGAAPETPTPFVMEIETEIPEGRAGLRARDENGRFMEMDGQRLYDLTIRDPETGESRLYERKSLKDLTSMAARSVHLQKLEPEVKYYRDNIQQWNTQHARLSERAQQMEALAVALLTESEESVVQRREEYAQRREKYAQQFTPESQIAYLQGELQRARQAPPSQAPQQNSPTPQQVAVFRQRTAPAIAEAEGLVGKEAAAGYIAMHTSQHLVNGVLPADRMQFVENFINGPFRDWAKKEAVNRTSAASRTANQEAQRTLEQARQTQSAAQLAARNVGTAIRPNPVGNTAPAAAPKPTNARDMIDHIARRGGERRAG